MCGCVTVQLPEKNFDIDKHLSHPQECVFLKQNRDGAKQDRGQNILICVPKMNEGLMGLERHKGE